MSAIEIIVGLPHLNDGALLRRAVARRMPVLISANCLSRWTSKQGWPVWLGWNLRPLSRTIDLPSIDLDSAGFVAHRRYGGFPWSIDQYLALARSYPFRRFASLDYCVEPEIAHDRQTVLERISRTISANRECYRLAKLDGIAERFMPVLQGSAPECYERCADALSGILQHTAVVGVGSMCQRPLNGPDWLISVIEHLHKILPDDVQLHLFGVKGIALSRLAQMNGRIVSIDSQAYGVAARQDAYKSGLSKTNAFVAGHMDRWYKSQSNNATRRTAYQFPLILPVASTPPSNRFEQCIEQARLVIFTNSLKTANSTTMSKSSDGYSTPPVNSLLQILTTRADDFLFIQSVIYIKCMPHVDRQQIPSRPR